jgi:two-component system, OmpR family, sensor histidine kinase KdpD
MSLKSDNSTKNNRPNDLKRPLQENGAGDQGNRGNVFIPAEGEAGMKLAWRPTQDMFSNWKGYIWGLVMVSVTTALGHIASTVFSLENIVMFYLLVVVISAIYWGLGPSIVVSISTVVVLDYFFIPPVMGFIPFRIYDIFTLAVLLIVSVLISYLAARFRQKSAEAERHQREIGSLYYISRNLANFSELGSSMRSMIQMSKRILDIDISIFLPDPLKNNSLVPYSIDPGYKADTQEVWAVYWAFQNRKVVGLGTDTFNNMPNRYLPLITPRGAVGVMILRNSTNQPLTLSHNQTRLLQAFADLIAVSIENIRLSEEASKAEVLKATEKLQTAILNSISHDLRTPLVSVIGVLSSLQEEGLELDDTARRNLIQVAYEDAKRLNNLIANLLDISRIESGAIKLIRQSVEISELIGVALERLENRATSRQIDIDLPADLPFIDVDSNLIIQVFINILDNALKYSAEDSPIEIRARQVDQEVEISFSDRGIGIPPSDLPHVFDKFFRGQSNKNIHGTGLGLSICKGIVESHGGNITAENRQGGGIIVSLTLSASGNVLENQELKR